MSDEPTCGKGLAEHAALPAKIAELLASLALNLEAHLPTIDTADDAGRQERGAYDSLLARYRDIAARLATASAEMAAYHSLPMARHVEAAFANPAIPRAFEEFVARENELLELLRYAVPRDMQMLAHIQGSSAVGP